MPRALTTLSLAIITAFAGVVFIASSAEAVEAPTSDFTFDLFPETLEARITGYTGDDADLTIPDTVEYNSDTYTINEIYGPAFEDRGLDSVVLPASITAVGQSSFKGNDLTKVTIPETVTSIGFSAFDDNPHLTYVKFSGPAPTITDGGDPFESLDTASGKLRVHYLPGSGFTNPYWHGYTTGLSLESDSHGGLEYSTGSQCLADDFIRFVKLTGDIIEPTEDLSTFCTVEVDLNGHVLTLSNITVSTGATLTIDDSATGGEVNVDVDGITTAEAAISTTDATLNINGGTVNVNTDGGGAGIGGNESKAGGTTIINGGTVNATTAGYGAPIGGGYYADGGAITINGGTVSATNSGHAAGVGGGNSGGAGGTITINGGTVTASSGALGAGIGGGLDGDGGTVVIGADADVTASGRTAIGGGSSNTTFGSLSVAGTLRVGPGNLYIPDSLEGSEVTIAATGKLLDTDSEDPVQISGLGSILNDGTIVMPETQVTKGTPATTVTSHYYRVTFDPQGGAVDTDVTTIFAKSFSDAQRPMPVPTRAGFVFDGWNTAADGSGDPFTASTTLDGTSGDGDPVESTLYAQWDVDTIDGLAPTISGTPREGQTLTADEGTVTPETTTFAYRWKADGKNIAEATNPTFKLGKAQVGRKITVTITASSPEQTSVSTTSAATAKVSSPFARILLSDYSIKKGQTFGVFATGLKPGQGYAIWLGGKNAYTGRADANGTVARTVKFPTSIQPGTRRVRVSGYNKSGDRTFTVLTGVTYTK